MKIRTRFFVAGFVLVAFFLSGLFILNRLHRSNARSLLQELSRQNQGTFDALVGLRSEPLKKMIQDYTYWDEMVKFVRQPDPKWARENLDELLVTQKYDALWVYLPDGRPVYSRQYSAGGEVTANPIDLPAEAVCLAGTSRSRFTYFFLKTISGLMEVRGATIHPTNDPERRTSPYGMLFVGQLWNAALLKDLAAEARAEVFVAGTVRPKPGERCPDEPWSIVFTRRLNGFAGLPVAVLHIRARALAVGAIIAKSNEYLLISSLFGLLMFGLLLLAVFFWIDRPMHVIVRSLDRNERHLLGPLTLRRDEFARLARLIIHFFDQKMTLEDEISVRKRMEEQLLQAQKLEAVGRLAGGIAHDFNNLLTVILGYSDMLFQNQDPHSLAYQSGQQISQAADRAAGLTRQLLAFSRKQVLQFRLLDLNVLIRGLEEMLRRLIGEHITMELCLNKEPACIMADSAQINQVIMNLVLNARDAMPSGGQLRIETRLVHLQDESVNSESLVKAGDYVQMAISDTGVGMDGETQAHLFEPFFTTKKEGEGTGLGLATVYGIVKQSGGYISVSSELGRGSVFIVHLSLAAEAAAAPVARRAHPAGGRETVLVVEDQPEVRELIRFVLSRSGYSVHETETPGAALGFCRDSGIDFQLLLTDVVLPGMNGAQLASEVQALRPDVHVLYMSGYTDDTVVLQQVLHSGKSYLQKPFSPEELQHRVREVLDN